MAKIHINPLSNVLFTTELTVQIADINYGGHLANDAVLRLCHEVRMRWLAVRGWGELNAGGAGLIMTDAAVQYLAQAHHGDVLRAVLGAEDIGGGRFALLYLLERVSDGLMVAQVRTGMACFDYAAQKPVRLPAELKNALGAA